MSRYRARPLEIEARRFAGSPAEMIDVAEWAGGAFTMERGEGGAVIPTIEIEIDRDISLVASAGDWIVRDPATGGAVVWTDDAFRAAWEPVGTETADPWPETEAGDDPLDLAAAREDAP